MLSGWIHGVEWQGRGDTVNSLQSLISELSQPLTESSIGGTPPVLWLVGAAFRWLWSSELPVVRPSEVPYPLSIVTLFPSHEVPRDTFPSPFPSVWRGSHINHLPKWRVASPRDDCILIFVLIVDWLTLCPVKEALFPVSELIILGRWRILSWSSPHYNSMSFVGGKVSPLTPPYSIHKDDLLTLTFPHSIFKSTLNFWTPEQSLVSHSLRLCVLPQEIPDANPTAAPSGF